MTTTPAKVTGAIRELCRELDPTQEPIYVDVHPEHSGGNTGECFFTVRDRVQSAGGQIDYGWIIWEWPGVLVEAEFHALWISPAGVRIDITPKPNGESRILFLPDTTRTFDFDRRIGCDNIRRPLVDEPDVLEYIELYGRYQQILRRNLVDPNLASVDVGEVLPIMQRIQELDGKLRAGTP